MQRPIFFLLIALLIPSVSADFLAFGDTTVNVVPCGTTTANVTIQNTGEQATYSLSVDGDASDYVTFSLLSFILDPNATATIQTFYNIPCNLRPGKYATDIYFSDGEIEKILSQELNIATLENINLTISQNSAVIAPCETAGYTLELHNPLNFTEIYNIELTGHPNSHISEKKAVLQSDERKTIIASIVPEDCTQSGTFPLTLAVETEKSSQRKEVPLELIIKSTDIPVLAEGTSRIRTDYVDSTADISIENTGDRTTKYTLAIEGITWASITPNTVTLGPGESKVFGLRLQPTKEIPKGSYLITLTAIVEQTGIRYSKDLTIALQPQNAFERNPALSIGIIVIVIVLIIGIVFLVRYLKSAKFKEKLRRWKEKRAAARKAREQKREAAKKAKEQKKAELLRRRLEQERKAIEKKQAERERIKKQVKRQLEREFKKDYHIIAKKDLVIGKTKVNAAKIIAIILAVVVIALIAAFWSVIKPNVQYVVLGIIILLVVFIAKKLSRARVIKESWKQLLAKQTVTVHAWKKGLSLLSATTQSPIKKLRLLIKKTKAKVAPSPAVYQTFLLKTNTSEDTVQFRATFTIPKRWIARKQISADEVRLARYSNQSWSTITLKKSGEDKKFIHFTADIDKHGTYSIYAKTPKKIMSTSRKLLWGALAVIIIAAAAIALAPQSGNAPRAIPAQTWQEGTVHSIDLAKYFKDPDGDQLSYSAVGAKHVTIAISGTRAYLTPEPGWTGEDRATFIADDQKGGEIASNVVPLRVEKNIVPTRVQPYITILLAILAIIIVFWIVRSHKNTP